MKNNKGITLMALVITIIVLLILVSITGYTASDVLENTKLEIFTTEMKIMQEEVNMLYQKVRSGDGTIQIDNVVYNILELGEEYSNANNYENAFKGAFELEDISTLNIDGYRYYDKDTIEKLELEGIKQEFLVNIETRTVISLKGIEYGDKVYYTLEQLSDGTYNIEYQNPHENSEMSFDYAIIPLENSWQIDITNIKTTKYVNKYTIQYQLDGNDYWETPQTNINKDDNSIYFDINAPGKYNVKITDATGNYKVHQINIDINE